MMKPEQGAALWALDVNFLVIFLIVGME